MKFNGEIKFPELDHPGVPVQALVEGTKFELVVEGESLGRWSLYDVEAIRLVASAFLLKLDGEEVTFVADDPIDFAYRGVEHMAEQWAQIKSKRLPTRSMAIRMSRKDTTPSRVGDLREAMEANLAAQTQHRNIAGESAATARSTETPDAEPAIPHDADWDNRTADTGIPVVGETSPVEPTVARDDSSSPDLVESDDPLAPERRRLEEERARLEAEARAAEEREAVRLEAYRLEMERLEREREEVRRLAETAAARASALEAGESPDPESLEEPISEPEVVEPVSAAPEVAEPKLAEPDLAEPEIPEPVAITESAVEEAEEVQTPAHDAAAVVDLNEYEAGDAQPETPGLTEDKQPEPALASAAKEKAGLMGAVRSAFARGGGKTHEHNFLEAPGGLGITRYVCEDCGYVSISA